ncbi:MAG: 3-isopropylmalate dehydratase small subunit [Pyrinomonadaceae bacterium]
MQKFTEHTGETIPLYRANIDTDQIIPKQFLKRIERTGFGQFLFFDWRFHTDGSPREDFVFNDPQYRNASVLVSGANFGCGSSREHAPWALQEYGFRVIIAPGFADIFYNNCFKIGLLPVSLPEEIVFEIARNSTEKAPYNLTVDLEQRTVSDDLGLEISFETDDFRRYCLLNGLDEIGLTLRNEEKIARFEENRPVFGQFS